MEKVVNTYECLFVVDLVNEEETKATVDKFTSLIAANAEVIDVNEWGKRTLAYPVNDLTVGYYVVDTFKAEGNFPAELERLMKIDEHVIRVLVLKLDFEPKPHEEKAEEPAPVEAAPAEAPADAE